MTLPEKLEQSIQAVVSALADMAEAAETVLERTTIEIDRDDEEGSWRTACDMAAQAREEARELRALLSAAQQSLGAVFAPPDDELARLRDFAQHVIKAMPTGSRIVKRAQTALGQ